MGASSTKAGTVARCATPCDAAARGGPPPPGGGPRRKREPPPPPARGPAPRGPPPPRGGPRDKPAPPPAGARGFRPRESDIEDVNKLYDVRDSLIMHTHRRYTGRPVLAVKRGLRRILEPLLQQLAGLLSANAPGVTAPGRAAEQQRQWVEELEEDVNTLRLPRARPGGSLLPDEAYDELLETVAPGATGEALQQRAIAFLSPRAPVLHAGCGDGRFLTLLARAGIEATGVDERAEAVRACQLR